MEFRSFYLIAGRRSFLLFVARLAERRFSAEKWKYF